jgi:uncharacterized protein involved in exopolysaccharide biosynthesis
MTTPRVSAYQLAVLLWSRRWLLALFIMGAALASAVYALTCEQQFESEAVVAQAKEETGQLGGAISGLLGQVAGIAGALLPGSGTTIEESVAVLNSRDFALRFMHEHGVLPYLFPRLWDPATRSWKDAGGGGGSLWSRLAGDPVVARPPGPSPDDAVKRFNKVRLVVVDRRTSFIHLTVRGPTAETAHAWATAMIADLNEMLRARALGDSRRAVELLSKRAETEQVQSVRTIVSALLELQLRHEVMAESRREYAVRTLDPPSLPDQRSYPRRAHIVLVGAALGFFLGAALVIARAAWRQRRQMSASR